MIRPRDFVAVLENPDASAVAIDDAGGALILRLLVHMFYADEELHEKELGLLGKLIGEDNNDALRDNVKKLSEVPMDFEKLAELYPEEEDRHDIITIAEHGYWGDDRAEPGEMDVLDKLAEVFGIEEH